jgi:hypothetical protein
MKEPKVRSKRLVMLSSRLTIRFQMVGFGAAKAIYQYFGFLAISIWQDPNSALVDESILA